MIGPSDAFPIDPADSLPQIEAQETPEEPCAPPLKGWPKLRDLQRREADLDVSDLITIGTANQKTLSFVTPDNSLIGKGRTRISNRSY